MEVEVEKTCSKCGETKPLSEFHKHKGNKDGYSYTCKDCVRIRGRAWREANPERAAATAKAWREANPEQAAATNKAWREANPEQAAANNRAWYAANRDRVIVSSRTWHAANKGRRVARDRARKEANPEWVVDTELRKRHDISRAEYNEMLEIQDNGCAICGKAREEQARRLSVDHDHETGQIRGLLCNTCNLGLGYFMDDPRLLQHAIAYLEKWAE